MDEEAYVEALSRFMEEMLVGEIDAPEVAKKFRENIDRQALKEALRRFATEQPERAEAWIPRAQAKQEPEC